MLWFKKKQTKELAIESKKELAEVLVVPSNADKLNITESMRREFVAIVAHQLRAPIADIKWSLRMILDGDFGKISGKQKKILEKTYNANNEAITLINDILNVVKIEEGKFLSQVGVIDMPEIIAESMNFYAGEAGKKNINIQISKSFDGLPQVIADREKLKIAIGNLLDNAIKYTSNGGDIKISLVNKEKEIEAQVQDTGIGIPESKQKEIFSKFFRAENAMRMTPGGSGLGLFITKYIIEAHGGKIWFKSKEGEGTIFYFTIPIKGVK